MPSEEPAKKAFGDEAILAMTIVPLPVPQLIVQLSAIADPLTLLVAVLYSTGFPDAALDKVVNVGDGVLMGSPLLG